VDGTCTSIEEMKDGCKIQVEKSRESYYWSSSQTVGYQPSESETLRYGLCSCRLDCSGSM